MSSTLTPAAAPLARQVRERFVAHMVGVLPEVCESVRHALGDLMNSAKSSRDMQQRRDALVEFEQCGARWIEAVARAWTRALVPATATARVRMELASLELIGDDVVENKILSSRLAMAVQEKAVWELNDLKLRVTHLEGGEELTTEDVLRPEALAQVMVEQWAASKLPRESWVAVKDSIQQLVVPRALEGYQRANEFLVESGVLPHIDLRDRVRRPSASAPTSARAPEQRAGGAGASGGGSGGGAGSGGGGPGGNGGGAGAGAANSGASGGSGGGAGGGGAATAAGQTATGSASDSFFSPAQAMGGGGEPTGASPMGRAKARATGVLGQLKRLLRDKVGASEGADGGTRTPPSPSLVAAVTHHATQVQTQVQTRVNDAMTVGDIVIFDDDAVEQVAQDLRHRSQELKQ
jgi:hypothetical protein